MPLGFEDKPKSGFEKPFFQAPSHAEIKIVDDWFAWSNAQGEAFPAPEAWVAGWLRLKPPAEISWRGLELRLEAKSLPLMQLPQGQLLAQWPSMPAGFCQLSLHHGERTLSWAQIFVGTPQLDAERWRALLRDLRYQLPTRLLIRLAGSGGKVPVAPGPLPTGPEEELALLLPLLEADALPWALRWLAGRANRAALLTGQWQPLYRIRRPEPRELARRLSKGRLNAHSPLWELRPELSLDQAENRFVSGTLKDLIQELEQLRIYLGHSGQSALSARLAGPASGLSALWQNHPLASLPARRDPPANRHLLRQPAYALCFEAWRLLHQGYLPTQAARRELPYSDLALLYQHWCLLRVADALLQWAQAQGFSPDTGLVANPLLRRGQPILVMRKGRQCLSLIPEASYGAKGDVISLSRTQRPDISLRLDNSPDLDGAPAPLRIWVLDAKFRSHDGEPLKDDLDKLHAYRDAIRHANGQPVIERAILLYPGRPRAYGEALEAWQLLPGDEPTLPIDTLLSDSFKP